MFKKLIKNRLEVELDKTSKRQYGFDKGRSTVHTIEAIVQLIRESGEKWVAIITLDIRIAFNTAS